MLFFFVYDKGIFHEEWQTADSVMLIEEKDH